jgi:hypothetical protein
MSGIILGLANFYENPINEPHAALELWNLPNAYLTSQPATETWMW